MLLKCTIRVHEANFRKKTAVIIAAFVFFFIILDSESFQHHQPSSKKNNFQSPKSRTIQKNVVSKQRQIMF